MMMPTRSVIRDDKSQTNRSRWFACCIHRPLIMCQQQLQQQAPLTSCNDATRCNHSHAPQIINPGDLDRATALLNGVRKTKNIRFVCSLDNSRFYKNSKANNNDSCDLASCHVPGTWAPLSILIYFSSGNPPPFGSAHNLAGKPLDKLQSFWKAWIIIEPCSCMQNSESLVVARRESYSMLDGNKWFIDWKESIRKHSRLEKSGIMKTRWLVVVEGVKVIEIMFAKPLKVIPKRVEAMSILNATLADEFYHVGEPLHHSQPNGHNKKTIENDQLRRTIEGHSQAWRHYTELTQHSMK